jgi:hypothetical protein
MNNLQLLLFCLKSYGVKLRADTIKLISLSVVLMAGPVGEVKAQQNTLRSFNDVLKVAIYLSERNPQFVDAYITVSSPQQIAMCATIGMKAGAVAAMNPNLFADNSMVKIHALNSAVSTLAHKKLSDQGRMPKEFLSMYVDRFKPLTLVNILESNWPVCDKALAFAFKRLSENEFANYVKWPYKP